ncbi:Hypothetical predicted protein, partial [Paramuricea clavata]
AYSLFNWQDAYDLVPCVIQHPEKNGGRQFYEQQQTLFLLRSPFEDHRCVSFPSILCKLCNRVCIEHNPDNFSDISKQFDSHRLLEITAAPTKEFVFSHNVAFCERSSCRNFWKCEPRPNVGVDFKR